MEFLTRITEARRADAVRRTAEGALERAEERARAARPARDFVAALSGDGLSLIAEVKRASPAKGPIAPYADAAAIAATFERGGANAVSVLTEPRHFAGTLDDLEVVTGAVSLPVVRKDFISDPLHVVEARAAGADAILLIVAALSQTELVALIDRVESFGMTADVEVHSEDEAKRAVDAGARVVAINNRDLSSLEVDLDTVERVRPLVPGGIPVVAESGIASRADVERMESAGVDAIHVGEALMRAQNPAAEIARLLGR